MRPGLLVRPRYTVRVGAWTTLVDGSRVQNARALIAPDETCAVVAWHPTRTLVRSEGAHAWVDTVDLSQVPDPTARRNRANA